MAVPPKVTPPPVTPPEDEELTLDERVQHLEEAVHALGTHVGASHPTFVSFMQRVGARIKQAVSGSPG